MDEQSIFLQALEQPAGELRDKWLDEACGGDAALRARLDALLKRDAQAGSFLDKPPAEVEATLIGQAEEDLAASMDAGLSNAFPEDAAVVISRAGHSVLKSLERSIDVPRVALRESKEEGEDPLVKPRSTELPDKNADSRFQLQGEIARGGMGAILKGRDVDLGRDLAIKVLLEEHKAKPEVIQRFVEEAQIGGQLQHPGIAPIYELGQFTDKRPFFAMKLVKGDTLSKLLKERKTPTDDRGKFLGIFEQICQTMAYAHSRGVIHRDLKPANIMVGAFGEVQVMDWGLAKVLSVGGIEDEKQAHTKHKDISIIQTMRSVGSDTPGIVGSIGSQTQMGSVMGTPAYMPPEQALGEIDQMDERADVFGLGAILCEILTGKPPYVHEEGTQVFRMATRGKLDECFQRLEACEADEDLVELTKDCLKLEPVDRPRNAGALAERVTDYLESVETKLREAEVQRAAEAARADAEAAQVVAERQRAEAQAAKAQAESARASAEIKRRRTSLALAISVLLLVGVGSGGWLYVERQEANRQTVEAEKQRLHATEMKTLADEKEAQRLAAEAAQKREAKLKEEAFAARERETELKQIAENREQEARRQYYASDSSNASFANRSATEYYRVSGYLDRWKNETNDLRDWEYYFLQTQINLPHIEFDNRNSGFSILRSIDWSPDARRIVTGSQGNRIEVYDAQLGDRIWRASPSGARAVFTVDWSPDGRFIASGCAEGWIAITDAESRHTVQQFQHPLHSEVSRVLWSPDLKWLVSVVGNEVSVWNPETGALLHNLTGYSGEVVNVAWSPNEDQFACCTTNGQVTIYSADKGEVRENWSYEGKVSAWEWSRDGRQMAFFNAAKANIDIVDVPSKTVVCTLSDQRQVNVKSLVFSPDGRRLATVGDFDRTLWDTQTGRLLDRAAQDNMHDLAWSPDGQLLAAVGTKDIVNIWHAHLTSKPRLIPNSSRFCWGKNGEYFLTSQGNTISVWDAYLWNQVLTLSDHQGSVTALCLSPDERFIASADDKRNLYIWDRTTGKMLNHIMDLKGSIQDLAYSPDQKYLSGWEPRHVHVWDTTHWQEVTGAKLGVTPLSPWHRWSPDSRSLLTAPYQQAFYSGTYTLWNVADERWDNIKLQCHWLGTGAAGAWNSDGTRLVIRRGQYDLSLYRFPEADELGTIRAAHGTDVLSVDWSPTGRRLVSVGGEGLARIWDVESLQQVYEIENAQDARWGPYGLRLAVLTPQGVQIHDATIGAARGHWSQLLPMLARQQELKHITPEDQRTIVAIHAHHHQWKEALSAIAALLKLDADNPCSMVTISQTFKHYAEVMGQRQDELVPPERQEEWLARWKQLITRAMADGQAALHITPTDTSLHHGLTHLAAVLADQLLAESLSSLPERMPHTVTLAADGEPIRAIRIEASPDLAPATPDAPVFTEYRILSTDLPSEGFRGRYVRLDLPGDNWQFPRHPSDGDRKYINLAELQVYQDNTNIALKKQARQSSTKNQAAYAPENAVNGDTVGRDGTNPYAHTWDPEDPWWEVDLGSEQAFDRMVVWNRENYETRMNHFRVQILDADRKLMFEQVIEEAPKPSLEISRQVQLAKVEPDTADGVAQWHIRFDSLRFPSPWRRFRIRRTNNQSTIPVSETQTEDVTWTVFEPASVKPATETRLAVQADGSFLVEDPQGRTLRLLAEARKIPQPIERLAATYHIIGDEQALSRLLEQHPQAVAGIGDLYAMDEDWQRAAALYSKLITDQTTDVTLLAKRAAAYMAIEQWELAKADWLRVIALQPDQIPRAFNEFKNVNRWDEAADFGLKFIEQNPDSGSSQWANIGPILALGSDRSKYTEFCDRMSVKFADSENIEDAERTIKSCLLLPNVIIPEKLPADTLTRSLDEGTVRVKGFLPWGWSARALLAWRNGDADLVLKYVARSEESNPKQVTHATNLALVAVAQHQLQHPEESRAALAEGSQIIARLKQGSRQGTTSDLLIAEILLREAEAKINSRTEPQSAAEPDAKPGYVDEDR